MKDNYAMYFRNIVLLFSLLFVSSLNAQKEDYTWTLGFGIGDSVLIGNPGKPHGGVNLEFKGEKVDTVYKQRKTYFGFSNASISDATGDLLLYTNGTYISNKYDEIIENGEGIGNPRNLMAYTMRQGVLLLQLPESSHLYYLIYGAWDFPSQTNDGFIKELRFAVIDMKANRGRGRVVEKNTVLSSKRYAWGGITACRHANGRDWWISVPGFKNNEIDIYLLDPAGIHHSGVQSFEGRQITRGGVVSTGFTPDGSKYYISEHRKVDGSKWINLFDFDRCSGLLYFREFMEIEEVSHLFSIHSSPNSKLLYAILKENIYQYDLTSDVIGSTRQHVAAYDGFVDWTNTYFDSGAMGPDGILYISTTCSSHYMHRIMEPNKRGKACNVKQHSFRLPVYNCGAMPNFPNFRLGPIEGSHCDSIVSATNSAGLESVRFFPNPTQDVVSVSGLPHSSLRGQYTVKVYNMSGDMVGEQIIVGDSEALIDLTGLSQGVYVLKILNSSGQAITHERVVYQP